MSTPPEWLVRLLSIPLTFHSTGKSVGQLFAEVRLPELSDQELVREVAAGLRNDPGLVDAWQTYSYDKRSSPNPYLDGLEVGFFDRDRRDVSYYGDVVDSCADFVVRETRWVLAIDS